MRSGCGLLALTALLAFVGAALYVSGVIGWAQFCWALASGTAGAGIALVLEHRWEREKKTVHDTEYWKNQPP